MSSSLSLATVLLASTAALAEPVYKTGELRYQVSDPAELPDFDLDGAVQQAAEFKTGVISATWNLAQPVLVVAVGFLVTYAVVYFFLQLLAAVFSGKVSLFTAFKDGLGDFGNAITGKLFPEAEGESTAEATVRARRNTGFPTNGQLMDLVSSVAGAISKYE